MENKHSASGGGGPRDAADRARSGGMGARGPAAGGADGVSTRGGADGERAFVFTHPELSEGLFERFSEFIQVELGIKMPQQKKVMLAARLRKRLRALGMETYEEYCEHVFRDTGGDGVSEEIFHMLDVITTNKTDFFREPRHFAFLSERVLPEYCRTRGGETMRVWSAGCSSGEEPYTLGMVLSEFKGHNQGFSFSIMATDVSVAMLSRASEAVYKETLVEPVPEEFKRKYLLRSKDRSRGLVRIAREVRQHVSFRRLNFMEPSYAMDQTFDVIFCRNVLIYFERERQEMIINRLCRHLRSGGHLFIGHSETTMGMRVPLKLVANSVYLRL